MREPATEHDEEPSPESEAALSSDLHWAGAAAGFTVLVALSGWLLTGWVAGWEAMQLLDASLPAMRFLMSGAMTAAATILALMLTLLTFNQGSDRRYKRSHLQRVRQVAFLNCIGFIIAVVALSFMSLPIGESAKIDAEIAAAFYYGLLFTSAGLGGLFTFIVVMVYKAVAALVQTLDPQAEESLWEED